MHSTFEDWCTRLQALSLATAARCTVQHEGEHFISGSIQAYSYIPGQLLLLRTFTPYKSFRQKENIFRSRAGALPLPMAIPQEAPTTPLGKHVTSAGFH